MPSEVRKTILEYMERDTTLKPVIGRHARVTFLDHSPKKVNAKVDTGADSSSVWASNLSIDKKGRLHFVLFNPTSSLYTGKEIVKDHYQVKVVRSSNGHEQVRYSVKLRVNIESRKFLATFTLADRSRNVFPVLIGSKLLKNKFVVDVARGIIEDAHKKKSRYLTELSRSDPKAFFDQYYATQHDTKQKET